ncbi:hypothetical protein FHX15_001851 [Rhizobium sp. BK650]|nr:hypothetical protein [Rhizobium sp. BK650]
MRKQPNPLIVTDRVGRQSRTLRQLANLHQRLLSSRRRESYLLERALSQEAFFALSSDGILPQGAPCPTGPRQMRRRRLPRCGHWLLWLVAGAPRGVLVTTPGVKKVR